MRLARAQSVRLAFVLAMVMAFGLLGVASAWAVLPDHTITGQVVSQLGPIAGAEVDLLDGNTYQTLDTTTTDSSGNYRFNDVADGDLYLWAQHPGLISGSQSALSLTMSTAALTGEDLTLNAPAISGRITVDGVPAALDPQGNGLVVYEWNPTFAEWTNSSFEASASPDGYYQIAVPDAGADYRVGWGGGMITDANGDRKYCYRRFLDGAAPFDSATSLTLDPNTPIENEDLQLVSSGPSITGTLSYSGGAPASDKLVNAYTETSPGTWDRVESGFTDANGQFAIYGLESATYRVGTEAFADDKKAYAQAFYGGTDSVDSATGVPVTAMVTTSGKDVALGAPDVLAADAYESDNSSASASTAEAGTPYQHTIVPRPDEDWIKVDVIAGHTYTFETTSDPVAHPVWSDLTDTTMSLVDSDGVTPLALNDDRVDMDSYYSRIDWTAPESKTVYLRVTSYLAYYGGLGEYSAYRFLATDNGVGAYGAQITGHVYENGTNVPIAGTQIEVEGVGQQVWTGADGSYTVDVPNGGDYYVSATHVPGHANNMYNLVTVSGGGQTAFDLYVDPTTDPSTIRGTVSDGVNALAHATLTITGGPSDITTTTQTDVNGRYESPDLEAGTYDVAFTHDGYDATSTAGVAVTGNGYATVLNHAMTHFSGTGSLSGLASDTDSGNYLEGVSVTVGSMSPVLTDSSGYYELNEVAPGTYSVVFSKAGYVTKTVTGVVIGGGASLNQDVDLVQATPLTTGMVFGMVYDAVNGTPLSGVSVSTGGSGAVTTDEFGFYMLSGLAPGTTSITFSRAGYYAQTLDVPVTAGNVTSQDVALRHPKTHVSISKTPGGNAVYRRKRHRATFKLTFSVRDSYGVCPGTTVTLQSSANGKNRWRRVATLRTDANGRASRTFTTRHASKTYYRWVVSDSAAHYSVTSAKQKITVK